MTTDKYQRQSVPLAGHISGNHRIRFGTDGWRGIIAKDFTFDNVRIVAQAFADYIKAGVRDEGRGISDRMTKSGNLDSLLVTRRSVPMVIVGYDNRFLSDKFAQEVARVLLANNINVMVSNVVVTSPSVSMFCKKNNCLGIIITASHNSAVWNGIKIKLQYGGSVSEKIIGEISEFLYRNEVKTKGNGEIKTADILNDYKKYLKSLIFVERINKNIVVDSMHGSSSGIFEQILKNKKNIIAMHNIRDPLFSSVGDPEPIEKNLTELKKAVLKNKAAVGFAFDGDADRLGVIDDRGRYLPPHIVFPLILLYLLEYRKLKGKIVQTISLGYLSEIIAKKFGLPFEEVPVGFKYVCEKMLNEDVLLGGEESGGYGWEGGLPERDGILNALLITEILLQTNKKLSALVNDLQKKFGKSYFLRRDIKLSNPINKQKFTEEIEKKIRTSSGFNSCQFVFPIKEVRTYDGIKIIFENNNWLLLRPSGTEPVLRTYAETDSIVRTRKLLGFAEKICFNLKEHGTDTEQFPARRIGKLAFQFCV